MLQEDLETQATTLERIQLRKVFVIEVMLLPRVGVGVGVCDAQWLEAHKRQQITDIS